MNKIYQVCYSPGIKAVTFTRCPDILHDYSQISPASQERLAKVATKLARNGWTVTLTSFGWGLWPPDWVDILEAYAKDKDENPGYPFMDDTDKPIYFDAELAEIVEARSYH